MGLRGIESPTLVTHFNFPTCPKLAFSIALFYITEALDTIWQYRICLFAYYALPVISLGFTSCEFHQGFIASFKKCACHLVGSPYLIFVLNSGVLRFNRPCETCVGFIVSECCSLGLLAMLWFPFHSSCSLLHQPGQLLLARHRVAWDFPHCDVCSQ